MKKCSVVPASHIQLICDVDVRVCYTILSRNCYVPITQYTSSYLFPS